jgi:RHS repeat-associated protein
MENQGAYQGNGEQQVQQKPAPGFEILGRGIHPLIMQVRHFLCKAEIDFREVLVSELVRLFSLARDPGYVVRRLRAICSALPLAVLCATCLYAPLGHAYEGTTCIEDGGNAECIAPEQGAPVYYGVSGVYVGPFYSEEALWNGIQTWTTYCSSSTSPSPPFSWTLVSLGSTADWTTPIVQTVYTGGYCDDPEGPFTEDWTGGKAITLSCPSPWSSFFLSTTNYPLGYCYRQRSEWCDTCAQGVANQIDPAIGNEILPETDYSASGGSALKFVRTYNWQTSNAYPGAGAAQGATGQNWSHNYESRLWFYPGGAVRALRPDGDDKIFLPVTGGYQEYGTAVDALVAVTSGGTTTGYTYTGSDDTVEAYDTNGNLQTITYRGGRALTLGYTSGQLTSVSDAFGHQLTFTYNSQGQIATMTDPNGGVYTYTYSGNQLSSVTYPDSSTRQYTYNESTYTGGSSLPNALTGVTDESGTRYETISYSYGQVSSITHAGSVGTYSIPYCYFWDGGYSYVTDPLGTTYVYYYGAPVGVAKFSGISPACPACSNTSSSVTFDTDGNVASKTDFNGNENVYTYDLTRNLETSRTEATGAAQARTVTTSWSSSYRVPSSVSAYSGSSSSGTPLQTTSYTYDSSGNTLTKTTTDPASSISRTWTYTYDSYGRVLTAQGPRTDVSSTTTYSYYTCTSGTQCGQVHTVTDALGNVTTYNTYNGHGQPLTITDPNGVVTTLTYDTRQRLTSRQVGSETTSFSYYSTGLLNTVTLPDGSYVQYTYDSAHRLTQISDGAGNSIQYTLDAMGNRTATNTYDSSGTLHRTHTRAYNSLNELYQNINAAGGSAVTTTYAYDYNGNQTASDAPLSRDTTNAYDPRNRLKQITDPNGGNTYFSYDAQSDLTSVEDPVGLTTSYSYNGFGDVTTLASPDTGTTTKTYDSGGNLSTSTDARSAISSYSYDALNRVTSIAYTLGSVTDQTISFGYDSGTNGKGRLTSASDASHSMAWTYDAHGRVTGKALTVGSVSLSVGYGYSSGDRTALVTPSGQSVAYGFNGNHQITSIAVNGTTVLNGVTYEPFGGVNAWTWGDSSTTSRTFNGDGLISQIVTAGVTLGYSFDNANRITGISDSSSSSLTWSYGYDVLDRLTSASTSAITDGWTYDANGNQLSQTGTTAISYTITSGSNQLSAATGSLSRSYSYDAAGNTVGYGSLGFAYNNRGRMETTTASSTDYLYNALGQMIEKSGTAGTAIFMQDESGHLIGEYDSGGNLIEETIWLGDTPVATLVPNGSGGVNIFYVHTDHLNTPRKIAQPSSGTLAWRWDADPFGTAEPNSNPGGLGTFSYNLRFPGQYYMAETGLNQNYFRDYDPAVGRYVESDPVGLRAGANTYSYVRNTPVRRFDSTGLADCDGQWVQIGWNPQLPRILRLCTCYWLCRSCSGSDAWSGIKELQPSTNGKIVFVGQESSKSEGDVEEGNSCLCASKPGTEKGCCGKGK